MNLARRTMNHPALAAIYERAWRPALFSLATGQSLAFDRQFATEALHLPTAHRVLDIACGPGIFTHDLSEQLPSTGFAVGVDYSPPMLARARQDHSGPRVGYVRGDARTLPFADHAFDAVCCFGALYLIPEPLPATQEMIRVLAPGGRIAITTSYRRSSWLSPLQHRLSQAAGLRLFDPDTFPDLFAAAGLTNIDQQVHRFFQYLTATKSA